MLQHAPTVGLGFIPTLAAARKFIRVYAEKNLSQRRKGRKGLGMYFVVLGWGASCHCKEIVRGVSGKRRPHFYCGCLSRNDITSTESLSGAYSDQNSK